MPTHQYDDIIGLPRPRSQRHRPMPLAERAIQFAPFAALDGHGEVLAETARRTESCPQLSEDEQAGLDARLRLLRQRLGEQPEVTVTWFVPDEKKTGGTCVTRSAQAARLREHPPTLVLAGGEEIPLARILALALAPELEALLEAEPGQGGEASDFP